MPQIFLISTQTILTQIGSSLSIFTFYPEGESSGYIVEARIAENDAIWDGVFYTAGDLLIKVICPQGEYCIPYIDENGNLFISTSDPGNYSVDQPSGELIYQEP